MKRNSMIRRFSYVRFWSLAAFQFGTALLTCQTLFAQEDTPDFSALDAPFPAFMAILFLPPAMGLTVIAVLRANRRERDKVKAYKPTKLAEMKDEAAPEKRARPERRGPEVSPEAKAALNISIIGIFLFGLPGLFGMLKGMAAKKQIAKDRRLTGEGTATAAILVGILAMLLWLIGLAITIVVVIGVVSG